MTLKNVYISALPYEPLVERQTFYTKWKVLIQNPKACRVYSIVQELEIKINILNPFVKLGIPFNFLTNQLPVGWPAQFIYILLGQLY